MLITPYNSEFHNEQKNAFLTSMTFDPALTLILICESADTLSTLADALGK